MFKRLIVGALICLVGGLYAQTDDINAKKYWKFRNNFRRDFVKIGPARGEGIPVASRLPIGCKNNDPEVPGGDKGTVRWADGMIFQGHYIGFLATEYRLLKDRGQDVEGTLNELYYALNAINRADKLAELIITEIPENNLPVVKGEDLNGFYLRDDADELSYKNWEDAKIDCRCTEGSAYFQNNMAGINGGDNTSRAKTNAWSTPSLDQMTSLLVGIKVISHLIEEDVYVQPTPEDPVMNIRSEAIQIANRLISYANNHNWYLLDEWGWPVGNGGGDLILTAYPITLIWEDLMGDTPLFINDITRNSFVYKFAQEYHCQSYADKLADLEDFGPEDLAKVGKYDSYNPWAYDEPGLSNFEAHQLSEEDITFTIGTDHFTSFWNTLTPTVLANMHNDWEEDGEFDFLPWPLNNVQIEGDQGLLVDDYNITIAFNLGVASGLFSPENVSEWGFISENYQLVLLDAMLRGGTPSDPLLNKEFFRDILEKMPIYGGFKFTGQTWYGTDSVGHKQHIWAPHWGGEYKWNDPLESNSAVGHEGQFNALDYMYLHNLYYLVYGDEIEEEFEESYDCFCGSLGMDDIYALQIESDDDIAPDSLTLAEVNSYETPLHSKIVKQLETLDFCTEQDLPGSSLSTSYDLKQLFDDYHDLGISLNKYQTEAYVIEDGGELNIESRFVICNTKELTVEDGGQINLDKGEILIKPGAKLIIEGDVAIERGTKVIVEDGGEIIIKTGGTLTNSGYIRLKDGAKMIYEEDATFKMQDDFAELHFDGGDLILKPNAQFTFEKGAEQSGQLRFSEWGEHIFTEGNNSIILTGNGDDDPIVVIDQDADFWAESSELNWMTITSGEIVLDSNARLVCIPEFTANNIHFQGENLNRGLVTFDETNISNSVFEQVPTYAALHYRNTGTFNMTLSEVNDNTDGIMLKVKGKGYNISHTDFNGEATYMFSAQNITEYSRISNSTFNGTLSTVGVIDNSNGTVEIKSCDFNTLYAGVHKLDGKAILRCNDFTDFRLAAAIGHNNCILDLSSNGQGGYNTFDKNDPAFGKNIALWNAQGILLNKGYNFFDESGTLPIIEGTMQVSPPDGVIPAVMANSNRWNVADIAPIPVEDFDVTSSIVPDLTVNFLTTTTEDGACPLNDDLISGVGWVVPSYQDGEATLNSLNFNQVSLSEALNTCIEATNTFDDTKNDVDALALFEEVLVNYADYDTSRRNDVLARYGVNMMKQTLQHAFSTGEITLADNQGSFSPGVQSYVNVLNAMTAVPYNNHNYEQLFYLEMDKAHLFQLLGKTDISLYLLLNAESCGLDSLEQVHLNHWKQEWDEEIRMKDYGYVEAEFKDTVWMDTTYYTVPSNQAHGEFGSEIVDISTINYYTCGQQRVQMKDESDHQILPLMVYPNPNTGVFQIEYTLPANSTGMMIVHDASGKEIYRFNCFEGNNIKTVDVNGIESGTYFYSYYINEVLEKTGQVVVK